MLMLLIGLLYLAFLRRPFLIDLIKNTPKVSSMSWRRDIYPFQWRIAVSWVSGYLVFQLLTPVLFATQGSVAAGRMGMSMQIFSALSSVAVIFVSARVPAYARLVAENSRTKLDGLFTSSVLQSFAALGLALLLVFAALVFLEVTHSQVMLRILSFPQLLLLAAAALASHAVYAEAIYLRAHKQEPFMKLSVLNGALITAAALLTVPTFGLWAAVVSYSAVTIFVSLPIGTYIFVQSRRSYAVAPTSI
jgi:O-antigen/teichoic acid export membrane protein